MDINVIFYEGNFFSWLLEIIRHPFFVLLMTYFVLDGIKQYRRVVGEIDSILLFYKNIIATPITSPKQSECSRELRKLAGDLGSAYNAIFMKFFFCLFRIIPSRQDIEKTVGHLGFLSNSVFDSNNKKEKNDAMSGIRISLKIPSRWTNGA